MPLDFALAAAELRHKLRAGLLRIHQFPEPLGVVVAVRSVVEVELYSAFAIHDELAIVAGQAYQHRPQVLDRIVRLGHRLGKTLIGLLANLFEHRLLAGNLLEILR